MTKSRRSVGPFPSFVSFLTCFPPPHLPFLGERIRRGLRCPSIVAPSVPLPRSFVLCLSLRSSTPDYSFILFPQDNITFLSPLVAWLCLVTGEGNQSACARPFRLASPAADSSDTAGSGSCLLSLGPPFPLPSQARTHKEGRAQDRDRAPPPRMAPLPPSTTTTTTYYSHPRGLRRRQDERAGGARKSPPPPHRSASFHGRTTVSASPVDLRQMQRPKTQPDLLAGGRRGMAASPEEKRLGKGGDRSFEAERRMPAKVLVNVMVQRSLGPVQVMASTEWTVGDLVAAALRQYVKEGRRPPLPTTEPSAFGLHYSQFSLERCWIESRLSLFF
ncbi:uncharacterized protein [Elaeis guineensis]|uniref:uncharacterized protein isoform X2 n=1 Tax=Elaeis guineensis var. tenera TaxID=51953 RepID=UPI003C6D5B50